MAAHELIEFLENGNIKNSVNYPDTSMPHSGDARICVLHKNSPNMLSQISAAVSAENINIENMLNRSKKEYAYTIVEINGSVPQKTLDTLYQIEGIIRVNVY
jgi:D-3-phosphoglycerate dehydrogenase